MERRIWGSRLSTSPAKKRKLLNFGNKIRMPVGMSPVHQKKSRIKLKKMRWPLLIFAVLSGLYYFFFISAFFSIKEIEIDGVKIEESGRIFDIVSNQIEGKKIFYVNEKSLKDLAAQKIPSYKFIKYQKVWPGKVSLSLEKRTPTFIVQSLNGIFFVDREHTVMDSIDAFVGYTVQVKYDKELHLGDDISDKTLLAAFSYVSNNSIVDVQSDEISITLENGGKVLLPKDNSIANYEELSKMLQKIIQKYTIENKDISTIDLRFSKPLIKSGPVGQPAIINP